MYIQEELRRSRLHSDRLKRDLLCETAWSATCPFSYSCICIQAGQRTGTSDVPWNGTVHLVVCSSAGNDLFFSLILFNQEEWLKEESLATVSPSTFYLDVRWQNIGVNFGVRVRVATRKSRKHATSLTRQDSTSLHRMWKLQSVHSVGAAADAAWSHRAATLNWWVTVG